MKKSKLIKTNYKIDYSDYTAENLDIPKYDDYTADFNTLQLKKEILLQKMYERKNKINKIIDE
jgi:hypothetical protein